MLVQLSTQNDQQAREQKQRGSRNRKREVAGEDAFMDDITSGTYKQMLKEEKEID